MQRRLSDGKAPWPATVELHNDIVEEMNTTTTTVGNKAVLTRSVHAGAEYEYVFSQPLGDPLLEDIFNEGARINVQVLYFEEVGGQQVKYKQIDLDHLTPFRRTTAIDGRVYVTFRTKTPPKANKSIKPPATDAT